MGRGLRFVKMTAVGNDFVVVDSRHVERSEPELARWVCDRRVGVGADGLLIVGRGQGGAISMRMFNPDGTEDFCGNGLRCVVVYARERWMRGRKTFVVETIQGPRRAEVLEDDGRTLVRVEMGAPLLEPSEIPMNVAVGPVVDYDLPLAEGALRITALSTGSTHAVTFVDELPDDETFLRVSPEVENHAVFPERTSLMWARVVDSGLMELRIWERGVGETFGCGTGACAAMYSAYVHGYVGESVTVRSRGGELKVERDRSDVLFLTGPARTTFTGVLRDAAESDG